MAVGEILQPSDSGPSIPPMFMALLICSDEACAEERETWGSLEELEALACDCGCALQLLALSEVEFVEAEPPPPAEVWLPLAA
jgi:hypothetical protein